MNIDYGKRAYHKAEELEERVSRLEVKTAEKPVYKTIKSQTKHLYAIGGTAKRKFKFFTATKSEIKAKISVSFACGEIAEAYFFANGELKKRMDVTESGESAEFTFDSRKGVNVVSVEITISGCSADEPDKTEISCELSGYIDRGLDGRTLKSIGTNEIGVKEGDTLTVYGRENGNIVARHTFFDAEECDLSDYGSDYVFAARRADGECFFAEYGADYTEKSSENVGASFRKFAISLRDKPYVYAFRGNVLKLFHFDKYGEYVEEDVGIKGSDVEYYYGEKANYVKIVDFSGNVFLFEEGGSPNYGLTKVYSLGKKKNLAVAPFGSLRVWYSYGGKIYGREIFENGETGPETEIATGEAAVGTWDGAVYVMTESGEINCLEISDE